MSFDLLVGRSLASLAGGVERLGRALARFGEVLQLDQLGQEVHVRRVKQLNLYEAKTGLSGLVDEAAAGEVVIIAKNGKPKAKLVAVTAEDFPVKKREFGFWGKYGWKAPDPFPELTEEEIDEWYNGPVFPEDDA